MDTACLPLGETAAWDEIAVALNGACGNVVHHAKLTDEYEVTVKIADGVSVIEVVDHGAESSSTTAGRRCRRTTPSPGAVCT